MGANPRAMLVLCDDDPIGRAVVELLEAARVPVRAASSQTPADELAMAAFGCRAIIAVGDRFAADRAVIGAANMPGVRALVVVARSDVNPKPLRVSGVPYTVVRVAPLLEEMVATLRPQVASGRLIIDPREDRALAAIAVADAAECAIAAVDCDEACGRTLHVAAPERLTVAELARRIARADGGERKVSAWPRWALAALRAIGRRPLELPTALRAGDFPVEDVTPLHPLRFRTVEEIAADERLCQDQSPSRRNHDEAMGM